MQYCLSLLKLVIDLVTILCPTETGKPGKWEGIFQSGKSQGILNRLEKSGKITQNTGKTSGIFRKMLCYFLVIFKNELCIMEKDTGKVREKSGNFVSSEKWEHCVSRMGKWVAQRSNQVVTCS